jgi:hypothetical protein
MSINHFEGNIMKNTIATTALIVTAALSAGSVFAADSAPQGRLNNMATSSYFTPSAPSVLSRTEVKAEYFQAQKAGALPAMGEGVNPREQRIVSDVTRAAIKAEYLQTHKTGAVSPVDYRG